MSTPRTPQPDPATTPAGPAEDAVRLDARLLRGLAHPVRVRLLGLLRQDGPATASGLAARIGESSGVTSYHLRQLAAYGFVVDDDAPHGSRRERWWKAAHRMTVLEPIPGLDEEGHALVEGYLRSIAQAYAQRLLAFADSAAATRTTLGEAWSEVADMSDWWLDLTVEEAERLGADLHRVLDSHRSAIAGRPRPEGTERVVVQLQIMPTATEETPR